MLVFLLSVPGVPASSRTFFYFIFPFLPVCTRMLRVCCSYALVCDSYVTRMYSYVIGVYPYVLVCTRAVSYSRSVKMPNFMFYGGRKKATTNFSFSF